MLYLLSGYTSQGIKRNLNSVNESKLEMASDPFSKLHEIFYSPFFNGRDTLHWDPEKEGKARISLDESIGPEIVSAFYARNQDLTNAEQIYSLWYFSRQYRLFYNLASDNFSIGIGYFPGDERRNQSLFSVGTMLHKAREALVSGKLIAKNDQTLQPPEPITGSRLRILGRKNTLAIEMPLFWREIYKKEQEILNARSQDTVEGYLLADRLGKQILSIVPQYVPIENFTE